MADKTFSPTRTKATWKPRVTDADLPFFACGEDVALGLGGSERTFLTDPGRNPVAELPYAHLGCTEASPDGQPGQQAEGALRALPLVGADELPDGVSFDYAIIGGYNNNAVRVSWRIRGEGRAVTWVALKTFTGMQVKYVLPKKRPQVLFALADEDAYVYCDKDPCLECIFMCKRGFVAYANVEGVGIVRLPLERASAHWESR